MTERAIKPKQPIKRKKKAIKAAKVDMPQPNSAAEAAIFVGSLGMALYAVFMFMLAFVALAFNDTGRSGMGLASLILFLFGINIMVQSVRVSKEKWRVDRYGQRIIAVYTTSVPLLILSADIVVSVVISVIGSMYLWFLLIRKDKLYRKRSNNNRASK